MDNYSREPVNIRNDSSSRDNRNIMDVNSSRTARIRQKESQQQFSREQRQELTTRTLTAQNKKEHWGGN